MICKVILSELCKTDMKEIIEDFEIENPKKELIIRENIDEVYYITEVQQIPNKGTDLFTLLV